MERAYKKVSQCAEERRVKLFQTFQKFFLNKTFSFSRSPTYRDPKAYAKEKIPASGGDAKKQEL